MADDYPSSNPFRRKTTAEGVPEPSPNVNHVAYQHPVDALADTTNLPGKKIAKKVRVQSPPPASPSISTLSAPDSTLPITEGLFTKPSISISREDDDDPFESTSSNTSEDEEVRVPKRAPANPFATTLATMEHPERQVSTAPANVAGPGRASMDVEAFKRLLMTGYSGLGTSSPPTTSQIQAQHGTGDSTDTSSISKHSVLFEPIQEIVHESPRTSHEEADDERHRNVPEHMPVMSMKKKPPPPSSRHGKLIRVELRDEPGPLIISPQPPTPGSTASEHSSILSTTNRSVTDLNKPLPPAPNRSSHESDRESIFDKESAGKTPEPPSPSSSIRRKTPPAPPLSRRHSHLVTESKYKREPGRLSPKEEEDVKLGIAEFAASRRKSIAVAELGRPTSNSGKPPPPPPTRKVGSVRRSTRDPQHNPLVSPSSVSLPPPTPPPARGSARSISDGRPASVLSFDMSTNKRPAMGPPPPPPRHGKLTMDEDGFQKPSEEFRRSSGDVRRPSGESIRSTHRIPVAETGPESKDILADITKLQREIDALRNQGGTNIG